MCWTLPFTSHMKGEQVLSFLGMPWGWCAWPGVWLDLRQQLPAARLDVVCASCGSVSPKPPTAVTCVKVAEM